MIHGVPAVAQWGSAASWEPWDTGSMPRLAQWVKDLALQKLWLRMKRLGSDPWPRHSMCHGAAKRKNKIVNHCIVHVSHILYIINITQKVQSKK